MYAATLGGQRYVFDHLATLMAPGHAGAQRRSIGSAFGADRRGAGGGAVLARRFALALVPRRLRFHMRPMR
jgi:hypothetical protein